jgi:hypothetical protein
VKAQTWDLLQYTDTPLLLVTCKDLSLPPHSPSQALQPKYSTNLIPMIIGQAAFSEEKQMETAMYFDSSQGIIFNDLSSGEEMDFTESEEEDGEDSVSSDSSYMPNSDDEYSDKDARRSPRKKRVCKVDKNNEHSVKEGPRRGRPPKKNADKKKKRKKLSLQEKIKRLSKKTSMNDGNSSEMSSCHEDDGKMEESLEEEGIFVRDFTDSIYNQVHACIFCSKLVNNIPKHLQSIHKNEAEVKEIVQSDRTQKEKLILFDLIRNKGDHKHNMKVVEEEKGQLILKRRPHASTIKLEDYGPCPGCLQWLKVGVMMKNHQKYCQANTDLYRSASKEELHVQSLSISGRYQKTTGSTELINKVFPIMTNDTITETAQKDPLIISVGNAWLSRNIGNKLKQKYYTSSKMREVSRLLLNARTILNKEDLTMSELLKPVRFGNVTKAALMTAFLEFDDEEELNAPSTAIGLGVVIKRMLRAKWAEGIEAKDEEKAKESQSFIKLIKVKWSARVNKLATLILQRRKLNMENRFPEPDDIITLQNKIQNDISNFDVKDKSPENFRLAAEMTQARLLLYNKRRSSEIEGIRLV